MVGMWVVRDGWAEWWWGVGRSAGVSGREEGGWAREMGRGGREGRKWVGSGLGVMEEAGGKDVSAVGLDIIV